MKELKLTWKTSVYNLDHSVSRVEIKSAGVCGVGGWWGALHCLLPILAREA